MVTEELVLLWVGNRRDININQFKEGMNTLISCILKKGQFVIYVY